MERIAQIPESRKQKNTIGEMKPGTSGWTVPWALWVDLDNRCFLLEATPSGTMQLRVARDSAGHYSVDAAATDHQWRAEVRPGYASRADTKSDTTYIPVSEFTS